MMKLYFLHDWVRHVTIWVKDLSISTYPKYYLPLCIFFTYLFTRTWVRVWVRVKEN